MYSVLIDWDLTASKQFGCFGCDVQIAVLEEQKSAETRSVKDEVRMKEMDQLAAKTAAAVGNEALGELNVNEVFKEETQVTDSISTCLFNL